MPPIKEQVDAVSVQVHGRPYSELTEEEKAALATAFGTEKDLLDQQMADANAMLGNALEPLQVQQAGNVVRADVGGAVSRMAQALAGGLGRRRAREGTEALIEKEEVARRAAGDVGANRQNQMMQMWADMMREKEAPAPAPAQTPPPTMSAPPAIAAPPPAPPPALARPQVPPVPGNEQEFTDYFAKMGVIRGGDYSKNAAELLRKQRHRRNLERFNNPYGFGAF